MFRKKRKTVFFVVTAAALLVAGVVLRRGSTLDNPEPIRESDLKANTNTADTQRDSTEKQANITDLKLPPIDAVSDSKARSARGQIESRIREQILAVSNETLQESIHNLNDVNMYYWPGPPPKSGFAYMPGTQIPVDPSRDLDTINTILSNRRFLRVYHDLKNTPDREALSRIVPEMEEALVEYDRLWSEYMTENEKAFLREERRMLDQKEPYNGPNFIIEQPDPAAGTMFLGARLKVLSLAWIAGELKLDAARPQVDEVVKRALQQRDRLYDTDRYMEAFSVNMIERASLYNRQILATVLRGVSAASSGASEWVARPITSYNAPFTEFDLLGVLPEFREGYKIGYAGPLDDKAFDNMAVNSR